MPRRLALATLLLGALLARGEEDDFPWLTDLDAARARAREEGRPLLVVFR